MVKVMLKKLNGSFFFNMVWGDVVIFLLKSIVMEVMNLVGIGLFKFVNWVKGDCVEFVKFDGYWGMLVKFDKVIFKFIVDLFVVFVVMMVGDVDVFFVYLVLENFEQFKVDLCFQVVVGNIEGEMLFVMNNGKKFFDNIKVCEVVVYVINCKEIIDGVMFGYGILIGIYFVLYNFDYVDLIVQLNYDLEKFKVLLKEVGYLDGFIVLLKFFLLVYVCCGGEIIVVQFVKVGIKVEIINVEWVQWLEQVFKGKDYDLIIVLYIELMDIDIYGCDNYYFNYKSDVFKKIMVDLFGMIDLVKCFELLKVVQKCVVDDYVNVFFFELLKMGVVNVKIVGFWKNQLILLNDMFEVYWKD